MRTQWMVVTVMAIVFAETRDVDAGLFSGLCRTSSGAESCGSSETAQDGCNNSQCRSYGTPWCSEEADECDCDRECCECCGKKKPRKKKKCCLFTCISCSEPPRGEIGMSVSGRLRRNSFDESGVDDKPEAGIDKKDKSKSEAATTGNERIDVIEKDLTRLTQVVESVAASQQQQQADLTKATQVLEELVRRMEVKP